MTRLRQADFETVQPALSQFTLSILVTGRSRPWRDLGDGLRIPRGAEGFRHHGSGILTPHGTDVSSRVEGAHDCLIFSFPVESVGKALEELLPGGATALYGLADQTVSHPILPLVSRQLWEQEEDALSTLFADHALALVLAELARQAARAGRPRARRLHGSAWRQRR